MPQSLCDRFHNKAQDLTGGVFVYSLDPPRRKNMRRFYTKLLLMPHNYYASLFSRALHKSDEGSRNEAVLVAEPDGSTPLVPI
jgi:hypothetical protein